MNLRSELRQLYACANGARLFALSKGSAVDRIDILIGRGLEAIGTSVANAQGYLHLAALLSRYLHLHSHLGRALNHLAWIALAANELETVLMFSNEALLAGQAARSWKVQAGARYMLANLHARVGDYARAEVDFLNLVRLAELNNDLIRGADYRYALARVRSEKFQFRAAIALGSAVYAKYVSVGDPQVTSLLNDLAHWYTQLEEYDEALSFTQKALAQCPAINLALRATLALTIAEIQIKKGDVTEAKRYLDLSKRLSAEFEIGFDFQAGMRLTSAEIKLADGDKEGSLVMLSALAAERDGQSYNFASAVRKSYVKALRLDGQIEKANQLERESAVIKRDFFRRQSDQRYQLARLQDRVNELIANWHQREAAFISGAG